MDMSKVSNFKAICYNCLYKLAESDITKNICPSCNMKIDINGFPLKGSSNYSWKKSDSDNKENDEIINKTLAVDQGFHYGTISRLRYGITEGNNENFIINPDKSFVYNFNNDKLMIHRYKLTKHPTNISRTSSINLMRNSIKEMISNSKQTPSILYIKLKNTKPNLPSHIILLEDKFLKARFGSVTGLNLLLNIIHTNNFFPVSSSLHRQTVIYKIKDNYEKTISESFLMPSSGLKVEDRVPHNHLSLYEDENKLKKEVEESLKFVNIEEFHQYIPTLAKKSEIVFDEGDRDEKSESGIVEETMDDNLSQISEISITSDGEIKSKSSKPTKVSLGHLGIKAPDEDDYESVVEVSEEIDSVQTKLTEQKSDKESTLKTAEKKKTALGHLGLDNKKDEDDESETGSNVGVDFLNSDQLDSQSKSKSMEEDDDESGTGSNVGVDFLNSDQLDSQVKSKSMEEDDDKSKTRVDIIDDKQSDDFKDDLGKKSEEESDEDLTGSRVGIDFLGIDDEEDKFSEDDNVSIERESLKKDTLSENKSLDIGYLSELEDEESEEMDEVDNEIISYADSNASGKSPKNIFKDELSDIDDYPTAMHNFWGEFKNSQNNDKIVTKTSWDGDDDDSDNELDIPTQSEREDENKKTKKRILKIKTTLPKKKVTIKKILKKTSKDDESISPKKTTKKRKPKKNTNKKERDSRGRFISSKSKRGNTSKDKVRTKKTKSSRKKNKKISDTKSRDSKGRFKSPSKKKRTSSKKNNRPRDSKGRFIKSP